MAIDFDLNQLFAPGGTPTGIDALFNEDQRRLMGGNANLAAAAALLQAGGRSRQRVGLGQALGAALQAGQQGYQQARAGSLQDLLLGEKLKEAQRLATYQTALAGTPQVAEPAPAMEPLLPAQASLISQVSPASVAGRFGPTPQRASIMDAAQVAPPAPAAPSKTDLRFEELMRKADIANRFNKPDDAEKFLNQAYKIKPQEEYSTTPQFGMSPRGTPISFVLNKSGGMKLLDVNRNPEFNYQDAGSYISVRDKNTNTELERIAKTMTPGETASNIIAQGKLGVEQGQLGVAQGNLAVNRAGLGLRQQEFARGAFDIKESQDGLMYVPKIPGGAAVPVMGTAGQPLQGAGAKLTEDQSKSAGFAFRMEESTKIFNQPVLDKSGQPILDPKSGKAITLEQAYGQPNKYQSIMRAIPSAGLTTGIANLSEDTGRQQYRQAQENWVSANLRPESGAVLGTEEIQKEIIKYFPQTSDNPETIAQKARARRDTELALRVRAGPGYKELQKQLSARDGAAPSAGGPARLVLDRATGVYRYVQE
jgi:hypothetical protein